MKQTKTIIASAVVLLISQLSVLSVAKAAEEISPEKAAALKPFDRIAFTGHFNNLGDASDEASKRADKEGAAYFYILDTNSVSESGNWRVVADLYRKDAPKASPKPVLNSVNGVSGVKQLPKEVAFQLEPFDTVSVNGLFHSQPDVLEAVAEAAKAKGAYSFFIVRQIDANNGGNQYITAFVYKKDAPKRVTQSPDAIPYNSEAGRAALAAGGAEAKKVEIPGVASSSTPSSNVGLFFQTQSSTGKRYSVTLPSGNKVEEVNNITAAQMTPFKTVTFTGHFNSITDVSQEVAKRADAAGAKFYHVTRQWQNQSGGNLTVTADLFK
ncbi:DUF1471 family protein YdgH [Serratia sp. M24T3]|uniref:DUF1471 family protein YdgH n=1 Tax=Serratia sp. M24T3 TaxID=932213 RepID=UPI00025B9F2E|nr:DUF1471 family protein YdgH [Serratia sp. M24T3]EIC85198.1 hypothetical protein SPM24T3_07154 [Serratia sp. M24T3]